MNKTKQFDVVSIGNPLLDYVIPVDDHELLAEGFKKNSMQLIDAERSKSLLEKFKDRSIQIFPGGSSANTAAGIAMLGGTAAMMGRIGNDAHAETLLKATSSDRVHYHFPRHDTLGSGHTITFITPDGERSFATYLGASQEFSAEQVNEDMLRNAAVLHLEGYQFAGEPSRSAAVHAFGKVVEHGGMVSMDLSDAGIIESQKEVFKDLVTKYADIVFVNEDEAKAFTGKGPYEAMNDIAALGPVAVVKLGERGSIIKADDRLYEIASYAVNVVNTNGAGDMFAAGLLYGIVHDLGYAKAGKLASYAAAQVVAQPEARLQKNILAFIESLKHEH